MREPDVRPRSRIRRILKWAGLGTCLVLAVTSVISLRWVVGYRYATSNGWTAWSVSRGCLNVFYTHAGSPRMMTEKPGWFTSRSLYWMSPFGHLKMFLLGYQGKFAMYRLVSVPLLPPAVAIGVATAVFLRRDRRRWKGYCWECGYDLTGNVSGVCPECGKPM